MIPSVTLNKTNIGTDFNKFIRNASIKMNNINAYLKLNYQPKLKSKYTDKFITVVKYLNVAFCIWQRSKIITVQMSNSN